MPQPPAFASEAAARCPIEVDTLVRNALTTLRQLRRKEEAALRSDSSKPGTSLRQREANELQKLEENVRKRNAEMRARIENIAHLPSKDLLQTVREIGETLDADISACPKVGAAKVQTYDSVCVARAEEQAHTARHNAVNEFLGAVRTQWKPVIDSLQKHLADDENALLRLAKSTGKQRLYRTQLSNWQTIEAILTTTDQITQLAAQFAR